MNSNNVDTHVAKVINPLGIIGVPIRLVGAIVREDHNGFSSLKTLDPLQSPIKVKTKLGVGLSGNLIQVRLVSDLSHIAITSSKEITMMIS